MSCTIIGKIKRMITVSAILFAVTGVAVFITYGDSSNAAENEQIIFSAESGCYDSQLQLSLKAPGGGDIYYTLDGSVPSPGKGRTVKYTGAFTVSDNKGSAPVLATRDNAKKYVESGWAYVPQSYNLDRASIVRAVVVADDGTVSPVSTRTYFVNNDILDKYNGCAVMSIVTDPDNLIGSENGIYVKGSSYDASSKTDGDLYLANFMQSGRDWERSAYMEFFDGSRTASISRGVGIRIHGGYSRRNQQKSFNIYFRSDYDYGIKNLSGYDLIPGATVTYDGSLAEGETRATSKYGNVMIRNGGNDVDITKFQDVFIQGMVTDRQFTTQASRPCMLYLNGEYWGLYNLTEKYGDKYLAEEFDVDKDNVIVYKDLEIDEGAALDPQGDELNNLMGLGNLDMTKQENYNRFLETVDVDSYIDYYATEIYINNNDWWSGCNAGTPHNNLMFWKVADPALESPANPYADGRWRYMLFDTEWSMGIYNSTQAGAEYDSIKYHAMGEPDPYNSADAGRTEANGDPVFRALFKNSEFRKQFTNTLLDLRNWNFEYERCEKEIDRLTDIYSPLMENNRERWNAGNIWGGVNNIKNFLMERPEYVLTMLEDNIAELNIYDRVNLTVTNSAKKAYAVGVNTIVPDSSKGFEGVYYKDYPITVTAKDIDGYTFDYWDVSGATVSAVNEAEAVVTFTDSYARINAVYTKDGGSGTEDNLDIGTYYVSEFAVSFAKRKNAGDSVGFEVQINDCGKGVRYGTLNLFAHTSPYESGEQFGRLVLSDGESDGVIQGNKLSVIRTASEINVDGVIDDAWNDADYVTLGRYQDLMLDDSWVSDGGGNQHCSAKAKFLWDDKNLYVLVVTEDENIVHNPNGYESDSVEIFYDEDAANPAGYTDDMFQFRLIHNGIKENGKGNPDAYIIESDVKVYDGEDNNGYIAEFAVPFKERKNSGDKVSLELQIADCISEADKRIGKLNLFADSSPFNDRSQLGLVTLCDNYQGRGFEADSKEMYAVRTDEAITADGIIEDAWQKSVPVVIEKYTPKDVDGTVYEKSIAATARIMWDSDNMYVLVKVVDNDLKTNDSLTESDCVELFFDERVDEDTLNSENYTTAFQYRISYDGTCEAGKNYEDSGYSVKATGSITEKEVPFPTPTQTASPTKEPAQTDEEFIATFVAEHASVTTYLRQNYSVDDETFINQNTAVARNSETGDVDVSGNGQINFTVVPKDGYSVESVSVSPQGNYKNIKPPVETGKDDTYRITKITGDITITITTKRAGQSGDDKNEFTATFDAGPNCSITTYDTQDYDDASVTHVNQASAVARDSLTGEADVTGNGQINFTVVPDAGYVVKEVVVFPKNYKNIKIPEETGRVNTYRVTKIIGDVTIKVTLEASDEPVKTNPPAVTESPGNTDGPDSTENPGVTDEPDVTKNPDVTKEPDGTNEPGVTGKPSDTPKPSDAPKPSDTQKPNETNGPSVTDNAYTTDAPANTSEPGHDGISGTEFIVGGLRYSISGKTAILNGPVKKTMKTVNIPSKIKWNGVSYKVTRVADRAFKNNKNLKSAVIGKNVTTIGKDSFRGCLKLSKIVVKSKNLKKIGKNAFYKTSKKMKLYVPKSRYGRYSKIVFKGKGVRRIIQI